MPPAATSATSAAAAKFAPATARYETLHIPTYLRQPERRLPNLFRDDWLNSYPDTQDDILGGPKVNKAYEAIILENQHLRLTILPELGGKLFSVYDKNAKEESVYVPDTIKPGLIHRAGAWIPGGMEFNFPIGHHIMTMRNVPCAILQPGPDHAVALVERSCARSGLKMELRIGLKAGEARFTVDGTLFNPTPLRHRWYQWTNVGCWAHKDWRFFSKADIYFTGNTVKKYPTDKDGVDISWVKDRPLPCDSFMVAHREDFFGCYDYAREHGLCHVAPWQELQGKKYFTWGEARREYDSETCLADDGRNYLEIQTGPLETQGDFEFLNPGQTREFHAAWIPFRQIGGIEWADRDGIFYVRDGKAWFYAAVSALAGVQIGARTFRYSLKAGQVQKLPGAVKHGDRVAITIGGTLRREFTYPLQGRQEPGGEKKWRGKNYWQPFTENPTAQDHLDQARRLALADVYSAAVKHFRSALKMDAKLHVARLELADALWHTGDFAAGAKELKALLKTALRGEAALQLARQADAEARFYTPVNRLPEGPLQELARAERLAGYGGFDAAFALYQKLLKADPKNVRVQYGLAKYYAFAKPDAKKAVVHAEAALALAPADRDLIIELCPIFRQAGRFDRVRAIILGAPKAVRELSILQKMLAKAQFELGEDEACIAIGGTHRLFNWEGEFEHVDTYQDSVLALLERALQAKNAPAIRRYAGLLDGWPKGLGILRRFLNQVRVGYWQGAVAAHFGHEAAAKTIWRKGVDEFRVERDMILATHGDSWRQWFTPQIAYLFALTADKLGDPAAFAEALALIAGPKPDAAVVQKLKNPAYRKRYALRHLFRDGMLAELRGDFKKAKTCYTQFLKTATETRIARLHLAAVSRGERYAE